LHENCKHKARIPQKTPQAHNFLDIISEFDTLPREKKRRCGRVIPQRGWIIPQGGLSGECHIIWEPGTYTNATDFNLDGTVNFKDFADFANTWLSQASWY